MNTIETIYLSIDEVVYLEYGDPTGLSDAEQASFDEYYQELGVVQYHIHSTEETVWSRHSINKLCGDYVRVDVQVRGE